MRKFAYLFAEVYNGKIKAINGEAVPSQKATAAHIFANEQGNAGWELVSVTSASTYSYTMIFKQESTASTDSPSNIGQQPVPGVISGSDPVQAVDTLAEETTDFLNIDIESSLFSD